MDFYIHLPSSSSKSYYPENLPSAYRTKLPKPINCSDAYEVALTEISYDNSIVQFPLKHQREIIISSKHILYNWNNPDTDTRFPEVVRSSTVIPIIGEEGRSSNHSKKPRASVSRPDSNQQQNDSPHNPSKVVHKPHVFLASPEESEDEQVELPKRKKPHKQSTTVRSETPSNQNDLDQNVVSKEGVQVGEISDASKQVSGSHNTSPEEISRDTSSSNDGTPSNVNVTDDETIKPSDTVQDIPNNRLNTQSLSENNPLSTIIKTLHISKSYYDYIIDLVDDINDSIRKEFRNRVVFKYDEDLNRIRLFMDPDILALTLSE